MRFELVYEDGTGRREESQDAALLWSTLDGATEVRWLDTRPWESFRVSYDDKPSIVVRCPDGNNRGVDAEAWEVMQRQRLLLLGAISEDMDTRWNRIPALRERRVR